MRKHTGIVLLTVTVLLILLHSCSAVRQTRQLADLEIGISSVNMNFTKEMDFVPELQLDDLPELQKDSFVVHDFEGHDVVIMRAALDDDGEMVAMDVLDAAVVTSTSRHLAERNGKIDIAFEIKVPESIRNDLWQLRFFPIMRIEGKEESLEPVFITGWNYNIKRLRGFEQYERWINKVVTDSTQLIDMHQLEVFIERNFPDLYRFKSDTSYVTDEAFISYYGVTEQEAIEHYSKTLASFRNNLRKRIADKKYDTFVKSQQTEKEIRLDTVMRYGSGTFLYNYVQTVDALPGLRRIEILLGGEIYQQDEPIYRMPAGSPLVFYVSSLSTFTDHRERYKIQVVERRKADNASYLIAFDQGKSNLNEDLAENHSEMENIRKRLTSLVKNETFDLDSVVVTASCSPEGSFSLNTELSKKRGEAVVGYFDRFMKELTDSIEMEEGLFFDEFGNKIENKHNSVRFTSHTNSENWDLLDKYVYETEFLSDDELRNYDKIARKHYKKPDEREAALKKEKFYGRMVSELYPKLRTVQFNFYLHRKGMVKDTIHTTVLDSAYMRGVQAIDDRDYETAIKILGPYKDYNAAIAYMSLDRNSSALEILKDQPKTDNVNYMLAVIYSRIGQDKKAVECYLRSCEQNPQMINRGWLDPEISALIKKYNLEKITTKEEDDLELDYL